ncbi:MAG TPA: hypothetical protein PLU43_11970, partial [Lachnospiraceae bacterium]|nr:hypothetical protein [Lachnospiraceae bacterium]
ALVHNGAFLLVDAINPDGTIVPELYHGMIKDIYGITKQYEPYVSGDIRHNAAVWFASHAKYDPDETGADMNSKSFGRKIYMDAPVAATSILRANNIPYDVIGSKNIVKETADVMILSHVANIREEEMDALEAYLGKGGNLYISGPIGNQRLQELLGIKITGKTEHTFTYMSPTEEGAAYFEGFSKNVPLTVPMAQYEATLETQEDCTVLATLTLPYTMTGTEQFSAIHSNPPGIYTKKPCVIRKTIGKAVVIWCAAPIELSKPYMSRQVFCGMIRSLGGELKFESNAPKFVEILNWKKDGREYFAVINQQEESPVAPVYDIWIKVGGNKRAVMADNSYELHTETEEKKTVIRLPKLEIFQIFEVKEEQL